MGVLVFTVPQTGSTFQPLLPPPQVAIPDEATDAESQDRRQGGDAHHQGEEEADDGPPRQEAEEAQGKAEDGNPLVETLLGRVLHRIFGGGFGKQGSNKEKEGVFPGDQTVNTQGPGDGQYPRLIQKEGEGDGDYQKPLVCPDEGKGDSIHTKSPLFRFYFTTFIIHRKKRP